MIFWCLIFIFCFLLKTNLWIAYITFQHYLEYLSCGEKLVLIFSYHCFYKLLCFSYNIYVYLLQLKHILFCTYVIILFVMCLRYIVCTQKYFLRCKNDVNVFVYKFSFLTIIFSCIRKCII